MQRKITLSQISPQRGQGDEIWMIDRETFSSPLLMFSLMCQCIPFIEMVWYLEHQVKVGLREHKIHRDNQEVNPTKSLWGGGQLPQSRYYNNMSFGWVGLATTFTLPVFEGPILQFLGNVPNHHICLRFRSGWCQDIPDSSSLGRKMKVCNTSRRDDVARFSGNELRQ